MAITLSSSGANLSAEFLKNKTQWPLQLRNDYISKNGDVDSLFANDVELDARLTIAEGEIVALDARVTINEANIATNTANIATNSADIANNAADIATNTADISTNTASIATNASYIADINDGRYSPQSGSGSPESVIAANLNGFYSDTSVPTLWFNDTPGATTGWVQLV